MACSIAPGPLCLENSHSASPLHSGDESPHPLSFQPLGEAATVSLAEKKAREASRRGLGDSSDKITSGLITVYANSDEAHCMEMSCKTIRAGTSDMVRRDCNKVAWLATGDTVLNLLCNVPVIR